MTEEGIKLIDLILSQINNRRLSTNSSQPVIDRAFLLAEVELLLSKPSNFELRNGRK